MAYQKFDTVESETLPGAKIVLWRMTEGRRLELRKMLTVHNARMRTILREQEAIIRQPEESRDNSKWWEFQDEADQLMLEKINPTYIDWGVKHVENVVVGDEVLGLSQWAEWPSVFTDEVLALVRHEVELNGAERKNLPLPITSGKQEDGTPKLSNAGTVNGRDTSEPETVSSISQSE